MMIRFRIRGIIRGYTRRRISNSRLSRSNAVRSQWCRYAIQFIRSSKLLSSWTELVGTAAVATASAAQGAAAAQRYGTSRMEAQRILKPKHTTPTQTLWMTYSQPPRPHTPVCGLYDLHSTQFSHERRATHASFKIIGTCTMVDSCDSCVRNGCAIASEKGAD